MEDDRELSEAAQQLEALLGRGMDLGPLQECADGLNSPALRAPVEACLANVTSVQQLHEVPYRVAAQGVQTFLWSIQYTKAKLGAAIQPLLDALESRQRPLGDVPGHGEGTALDKAREGLREVLARDGAREEFAHQIDSSLASLLEDAEFKRGLEAIMRSSVPLLWTAFECLTRDLWVAAVNAGSPKLAHRAFSAIDDSAQSGGVTSKVVPVGLLARHGFPLCQRSCRPPLGRAWGPCQGGALVGHALPSSCP